MLKSIPKPDLIILMILVKFMILKRITESLLSWFLESILNKWERSIKKVKPIEEIIKIALSKLMEMLIRKRIKRNLPLKDLVSRLLFHLDHKQKLKKEDLNNNSSHLMNIIMTLLNATKLSVRYLFQVNQSRFLLFL